MTTSQASEMPTVVIVTFPSVSTMSQGDLRRLLEETGPKYTAIEGLKRKYFISGEQCGGGVYEWRSRPLAEQFYTESWYSQMHDRTGTRPTVTFYDAPAIADGISHQLEIFVSD
ncbi:MAG: hypothetical protein AB8B96_16355 [Lysobacterales bacterium]